MIGCDGITDADAEGGREGGREERREGWAGKKGGSHRARADRLKEINYKRRERDRPQNYKSWRS